MHKLLFSLCVSLALPGFLRGDESVPFEGRLVYEVDSGGMSMTYTVWFKGDKWRSELKSGAQVFDLRLGDLAEGAAYRVNEGGKTYRMLGGVRPEGGGRGMKPPGGNAGKRKSPEEELEKAVVSKKETREVLGFECRLEQLKGAGAKVSFWLADGPAALPGAALPRLKAFEGKERLLMIYLENRGGLPLLIESGAGKKKLEMRAVSLDRVSVDEAFVSLAEDYKLEGGMRPAGGGGGRSGRRPGGGGGRPRGGM